MDIKFFLIFLTGMFAGYCSVKYKESGGGIDFLFAILLSTATIIGALYL